MNGEEAMTLLEQHACAVTVLFFDVEMPARLSGFELAQPTAERWSKAA